MLKLKENVDFEELRKYGFKPGKEWAKTERCTGEYHATYDWWLKYLMDEEEPEKVAYTSDEYDIPCVGIGIMPSRVVYIDYSVESTYHIGGSDVDIVNDTLFDLITAGLLVKE